METEPMCRPICLQSHMLSHHKHVMQYSHVAGIMPGGGGVVDKNDQNHCTNCLLCLFVQLASLLHVSTNSANFSSFG